MKTSSAQRYTLPILVKDNPAACITENPVFTLNVESCRLFYREEIPDWKGVSQAQFHCHSRYECHVVRRGECVFQTPDGTFHTVGENQFIIFPTGKRHRIHSETNAFSKVLMFFELEPKETAQAEFYRVMQEELRSTRVYEQSAAMAATLERLVENAGHKNYDYENLAFAYLVSWIIEAAQVVVGEGKLLRERRLDDPRVELAVQFIKENISRKLTTSDVADYLSLSSKQMTRIFEQALNQTPAEYIKAYKMKCVRDLLLHTEMSLSEISDSLGFSDTTAMINMFRRFENVSPVKFRKCQGKPE